MSVTAQAPLLWPFVAGAIVVLALWLGLIIADAKSRAHF